MKNLEKFTKTADALKVYGEYVANVVTDTDFQRWLQQEYVAPREPTLLEAAKKAVDAYGLNPDCQLTDECMDSLGAAIEREHQKPLRNCDRYKTAKEAIEAFDKMFLSHCWSKCNGCPIGEQKVKAPTSNCMFLWLYAETEKEAGR